MSTRERDLEPGKRLGTQNCRQRKMTEQVGVSMNDAGKGNKLVLQWLVRHPEAGAVHVREQFFLDEMKRYTPIACTSEVLKI